MNWNHSFAKLAFALTLAASPLVASAQFDFGGGATGPSHPWDDFKLNSKTRLKLDYRNASVDNILSLYQKTSGVTIVKDPTLTGGMTLTSAKPVSLSDAFSILSTTLSLKGFEMAKEGNLLVIRAKKQQGGGPGAGMGVTGFPGAGFPGADMGGGGDRTILRVYPIQYANASQLARVLNDVFTPAAQTGFPFGGFGGGPGGRGGGRFGGGQPGGGFPGGGFQMGRGQNQPNVRASSDDFSNSVIVNAPERDQTQVRDLIKELDKQTDQPQISKVYKLQYASVTDLQAVVQNVLTANVPRGKGGSTTQQTQGPAAFFQALRGGVAGSGQVAVDQRTNSLVVTATPDNIAIIDRVVQDLDTKVAISSTTFVFQLSNARADSVATLFQQAFGTRQGLNGGGYRPTSTGTTNTGRINPNQTSTGTSLGGGSNRPLGLTGSVPDEQQYAQVDMQDPNADSGPLATRVGVAQGFGGGFFGGGGQNRTGTNQQTTGTARDPSGRLINTTDLTGQVTAIPDVNTNSIIVVTSPDNAALIQRILDQLDKIPEQVMIETIIVEATLDASTKLGVEWSKAGSLAKVLGDSTAVGTAAQTFGLTTDPTTPPTGFKYTVTGKNFNAFVNALQSDSKFQILSTPRIFTSNNVTAQINISQSLPYITNTTTNTTTGAISSSYSFENVGIILTVTPRITSNGYVTMDVTQTANDLQGYTTFNAPIINQREADTTVSVRDGETIVLGGIIRRTITATHSKIPILGDIPILGNIFRTSSKDDQKTELLVFLRPRIVKDADEARRLREEEEKGLAPSSKSLVDSVRGPQVTPATPKTGTTPDAPQGGPTKP